MGRIATRVLAKRAIAVAITVAMVLVAASCASGPAGPEPVGALWARRSAAVMASDHVAFMATVDPEAPAPFRQAQERLFAGLSSVPFAVYAVSHDGVRWRLDGFPADTPVVFDSLRYETIVRDGSRYVSGQAPGAATQLWDYGPLAVVESDASTVIVATDGAVVTGRPSELSSIVAGAQASLVAAGLGPHLPERALVMATPVEAHLAAILQVDGDLSRFNAFTVTGPVPLIVVNDAVVAGLPVADQTITLAHELVHVVGFGVAGDAPPVWLLEGLAEWYAHDRPPPGPSPSPGPTSLPSDDEFLSASVDVVQSAYGRASSAIAFLAERRGSDAPLRLLEVIGEGASEAEAFDAVWGGPRADFEASWVEAAS